MRQGMPFDFEVPFDAYYKADAPKGKQRRIGGVISTETPDREGEVVLQRGLDFSDFVQTGWFNDNHSKTMDGVVGYPELIRTFDKGDTLPNGSKAKAKGTWAEGYLLDTQKGDRIWELAQSLKKTNRRLGFSVEGSIHRRQGTLKKTIAQATVRNIAITHVPINTNAKLEILAKSLQAVEAAEEDQWEKALGMGTPATPGTPPTGPQTGIGAGQVLTPESLESDETPPRLVEKPPKEEDDDEEETSRERKPVLRKAHRNLTDDQAIAWYQQREPIMTRAQAGRLVTLTRALKASGRL